jgi:hypothetical protein
MRLCRKWFSYQSAAGAAGLLRGKSREMGTAIVTLLVLVAALGTAQGLPQCRDESNKTVDW